MLMPLAIIEVIPTSNHTGAVAVESVLNEILKAIKNTSSELQIKTIHSEAVQIVVSVRQSVCGTIVYTFLISI